MDKNQDRYEYINKQLNVFYPLWTKIRGIDFGNITNDINSYNDAYEILKINIEKNIGKNFFHHENNSQWIYDGKINNSFPGLSFGHQGTKGLTLSNIKAFILAKKMNFKYFCILEDDVIINSSIHKKILTILEKNIDIDVFIFDSRGFGGTSCVIYSKKIIDELFCDLHPLSEYSQNSEKINGFSNLWDWKLYAYIKKNNIKHKIFPVIKSGNFKSTINTT